MSGTASVPNVFAPFITAPISQLDQNFAALVAYINIRQWTIGPIASRPGTSVDGQGYLANDLNGGTPFIGNGAGGWVQLAAPVTVPPATVSGTIFACPLLLGSRSGVDYTTTSGAYVDVDAANLKVSIPVPVGAKFALAMASYAVGPSVITDALDHVRIFGAGQPMIVSSFTNNAVTNPVGARTIFGLLATPASGPQDFTLQFRGDGANSFTILNPVVEGTIGFPSGSFQPMLLVIVTN
jgi:hypothetical protein